MRDVFAIMTHTKNRKLFSLYALKHTSFFSRKLAIQYLEVKVIPIMAKVIAFIDTNRNLDILVRNEMHTWQIKLFFETLNLAELEHLNFANTISSMMIQELKMAKVKTTSLLGNTFNAYIPFSWILYEQTELLLKTQLDERDTKGM